VTAIVLDTHVLHWWAAEPHRVSRRATQAIEGADELVVADITWFELAWLARNGRIGLSIPLGSWLGQLAAQVRTIAISSSIAATAVSLPVSFPGDPADRLICATAMETGLPLATKDQRLRGQRHPGIRTVW
jgi:PIN domain nuclease of toxin-antitoxin system